MPSFRRPGRPGRGPYQEPANEQVVARMIAAQLGHMIDRAEGSKLTMLGYLLDLARIEAERIVGAPSPPGAGSDAP